MLYPKSKVQLEFSTDLTTITTNTHLPEHRKTVQLFHKYLSKKEQQPYWSKMTELAGFGFNVDFQSREQFVIESM